MPIDLYEIDILMHIVIVEVRSLHEDIHRSPLPLIGKAPHRPDPCDFWGTKKLLGHVSNVEGHMLNNNHNTNHSTITNNSYFLERAILRTRIFRFST